MFFAWVFTVPGTELVPNECSLKEGMNEWNHIITGSWIQSKPISEPICLCCSITNSVAIPGLGRSPGEEKGYPFQYAGLENSMEWTVHGVTKSQTWLSNFHSVTHFHAQNVSVWTIRSAFRLVPMFFWHPIVFLWAFSYFLGPGSLFFLFSPGINHFSKKSQFHLLVYI